MKNLVMKSTTILFACLCFTTLQRIEAKCCGKDDQKEQQNQGKEQKEEPTVIERIKNKISKILYKNTETENQEYDENAESQKCTSCPSTEEQCSADCNTDKKDAMITCEVVIEQSNTATIETLSASDLTQAVSAIIAEEIAEEADVQQDNDAFADNDNDEEEVADLFI